MQKSERIISYWAKTKKLVQEHTINLRLLKQQRQGHILPVLQAQGKIYCLMAILIQDLKIMPIILHKTHWLHRRPGRPILEPLGPRREDLQLYSPNSRLLLMSQDLDNIVFLVLFRKRRKRIIARKVQEASSIPNFHIHLIQNLIPQFLIILLLVSMKKLEISVFVHCKEVYQVISCFWRTTNLRHHLSHLFQGLIKE